ncbi:hypothetical protein PR048_017641 [Dryococelus australis]|uniref:THAP-type domain-containing protein n=1 Tax=Dryococelus australis TaxID=614101 RepID=A0ABQ9HAN1_9NEOP|nr:hypothetical protein PR048_017641 [Dryococelus australis]
MWVEEDWDIFDICLSRAIHGRISHPTRTVVSSNLAIPRQRVKFGYEPLSGVEKFGWLLTLRSREPMRVKRGEYEPALECKGGGKREIPEKIRRSTVSSNTNRNKRNCFIRVEYIMPCCAVQNGRNYSMRTGSAVMYQRFPNDLVTWKNWIFACKRKVFKADTSKVCSIQFSENDYERDH